MNSSRWEEISRRFTAIVEQPPSAWSDLLDELCPGDDPEIRREVERMLDAEQRGYWRLTEPPLRVGDALPKDAIPPEGPLRAGPYRLLHPIGRGALSEVFLGVRDDDAYMRRVAVKLIRPGLEERSTLRRFVAERQILASLDHPHIAKLYDGGTSEEGRPYLAMEYIDGLPITEYCDRHRLGIDARLRLFLQVCAAVEHAHQNLLVHRDLKPGNILVTAAGEAKLLDFGIAKPLGPMEGLETGATRTGHRPMTPVYASPEQVRSEPITMASDVYSLGVLLCELISGERPYRLAGQSSWELERAICELDAVLPSQLVSRAPEASAREVARSRHEHRESLRRRLSGDLDTIVAKSLRKEPHRRYYSARDLGSDVRRHLADLPIAARQDHLRYRLHKFVRRNRRPVVAASTAGLLIVGLLALLGWQARLVEQSRSQAEQVSDLLVERLATGETGEVLEEVPVPREALDLSLTISGQVLDDPTALADMLETMGRVHQQAGRPEDALWMFEESLGLRRRHLGEEDLSVATSLHVLGVSALRTGDLDRGERLLREALDLRRRNSKSATWAMAESLTALGRHSWGLGELDEAEALLEESLEVRLTICRDSAWTARGLSDLAEFRLEQQRFDEAVPLQTRAAAIRADLSPTHFDQPRSLEDQALLQYARGQLRLAEGLFLQAVEQRRTGVGAAHPELSRALVWQARSLIPQRRYREAVDALREALAVHRRLRLGEGAAQADLLKLLGFSLAADGESAAGTAMLRTVIERESSWLSPRHPRVAISRQLLARALHARGDLARAEDLYRQAAIDLASTPEWGFGAGTEARLGLVAVRLEQGDAADAVREARHALELLRRTHPSGHFRLEEAERLLETARSGAQPARRPLEARLPAG